MMGREKFSASLSVMTPFRGSAQSLGPLWEGPLLSECSPSFRYAKRGRKGHKGRLSCIPPCVVLCGVDKGLWRVAIGFCPCIISVAQNPPAQAPRACRVIIPFPCQLASKRIPARGGTYSKVVPSPLQLELSAPRASGPTQGRRGNMWLGKAEPSCQNAARRPRKLSRGLPRGRRPQK